MKGSYLVDLVDGVDPEVVSPIIAAQHGGRVAHVYANVVGGFAFRGPDAAGAALAADPRVLDVYPDRLFHPAHHRKVARPELEAVRAVQAWHIDANDARFEGRSAIVAVLDAGVQVSNPNLGNGNNVPGERGDRVRAVESCIGGSGRGDQSSHGTQVTGTAVGGLGVLPSGGVFHVEVASQGPFDLFPESDLVCGFDKVKARLNKGMGIGAVNLSYYVTGEVPMVQQAMRDLRQAGVLTVVAAGNSSGRTEYPARYPEAVAVSATDKTNTRFMSTYSGSVQGSSYGPEVDLAAPGDNVTTTAGPGAAGTSFSAPHVAAAVALVKSLNPGLSADDLVARLQRTGMCPGAVSNADGGNCDGPKRAGDPDGFTEPALNVEAAVRG